MPLLMSRTVNCNFSLSIEMWDGEDDSKKSCDIDGRMSCWEENFDRLWYTMIVIIIPSLSTLQAHSDKLKLYRDFKVCTSWNLPVNLNCQAQTVTSKFGFTGIGMSLWGWQPLAASGSLSGRHCHRVSVSNGHRLFFCILISYIGMYVCHCKKWC